MAAMGRKEQENKALRDQIAQLTAQEPSAGGLAAEQWEPGTKLFVNDDGQLEVQEPPTPQNPNESSYLGRGADPTKPKGDDGSVEWAREQMLRSIGAEPEPKGWLG
jgi:hypothetical protein